MVPAHLHAQTWLRTGKGKRGRVRAGGRVQTVVGPTKGKDHFPVLCLIPYSGWTSELQMVDASGKPTLKEAQVRGEEGESLVAKSTEK